MSASSPATRPSSAPKRNRRTAEHRLAELKQRPVEISDLRAAASLLGWDQATYMPKGGADARGRQGAVLHRLAHERSIDRGLGRLLDGLQAYGDTLSPDSDDASLIRVARRNFEKAIKIPTEYVGRYNAWSSGSYDAWTRARPDKDFAAV